jgi:hypothetical protein
MFIHENTKATFRFHTLEILVPRSLKTQDYFVYFSQAILNPHSSFLLRLASFSNLIHTSRRTTTSKPASRPLTNIACTMLAHSEHEAKWVEHRLLLSRESQRHNSEAKHGCALCSRLSSPQRPSNKTVEVKQRPSWHPDPNDPRQWY